MSVKPISKPLPGERVVGLAPENAAAATRWWLRRPNLYPSRTLTAPTLEGRQHWAASHVALRGQSFTPGVVQGLEVGLARAVEETADSATAGIVTAGLVLMQGHGLTVSGQDVQVAQAREVQLADLPVVADPSAFAGMRGDTSSPGGGGTDDAAVLGSKVIGRRLGEMVSARPDALPRVGILLLQPVKIDRIGEFDSSDPCVLDACADAGVVAFEDWRIGDGVRLLWYAWPEEWRALPAVPRGSFERWRNLVAWRIFDGERALGPDERLPWESFGVPIGLVGCDAAWAPRFVDRAGVARPGGRARYVRMGGGSDGLATHWRWPALWQAQIEQLAEQLAEAGESAADAATLAGRFSRLPPFGLLPVNAVDLEAMRSDFFPSGYQLDVVPMPLEQLDVALAEAASLAPLELVPGERVRVLVPVPQAVFDPRLLLREVIDPEFAATLAEFLLERARWLGARQGLRRQASLVARAISGKPLPVPEIADDPEALETEDLVPWGPPPAGGGHRSSIRAGVHQHLFAAATETMSVATGEELFAWVYLDPDNPPRTLMLQWQAGDWEHRAYWGENLLSWGTEGSTSHRRMDDLPPTGQWTRLTVPAAQVGLAGQVASGMAFSLYDGRAAFGTTGVHTSAGERRRWFGNILPENAQRAGDERWVFLSHNDLWAPFEPRSALSPVAAEDAPPQGGHSESSAAGLHQHYFQDASTPFTPGADERLFTWVFLDPNHPPTQLMLQWHSGDSWGHRAYWGLSRISWGSEGTASRRRIDALPEPGKWVRLEVPVADLALADTPLNGMAFTLYDGGAAFGPSGASSTSGAERVWFAGNVPAGAQTRGRWELLQPRDLRAPTSAGRNGRVRGMGQLYADAALAHLSRHERYQVFARGLEGFISYLKARADRADDLVDYSFIKVQTDIYRVRQLVLGTTEATRLAVSPALAEIAKAETAVASAERISSFFTELRKTGAPAAEGRDTPAGGSPPGRAGAPAAGDTPVAGAVFTGGASVDSTRSLAIDSGPRRPDVGVVDQTFTAADARSVEIDRGSGLAVEKTGLERDATKAEFVVKVDRYTPKDITDAAPLIGKTEVRTVSIAERLQAPKATEAKDYATSSRYEAVRSLLQFADELTASDGGDVPGLFEGLQFYGLRGDPVLFYDAEQEIDSDDRPLPTVDDPAQQDMLTGLRRSLPLRTIMNERWRLPLMLRAPLRTRIDESAQFSDGVDLSDNTVALMRQLEGRIKRYRDAIAAAERLRDRLRGNAVALEKRLLAAGESLAEARHDVSVTRALIAEEGARLEAINTRRADIRRDHVRFLAFQRPRETELTTAAPVRTLDPGLLAAPVPVCLRQERDEPDDLRGLLALLREAPVRWFTRGPQLIKRLDRLDLLVKTVQAAQLRAQLWTLKAGARPAMTGRSGVAGAIAALQSKRSRGIRAFRSSTARIDPVALSQLSWQAARTQVERVVSIGDLIDGEHGRGELVQQAAGLFDEISRIAACLHTAFSEVSPSIRLDWVERMSQFDVAPRLRNLAGLPRWGELDFARRRALQGYADWLFGQVRTGERDAEELINDIIHMCLLLASHAPVNRIIAGHLPEPVTVRPGVRLPIKVTEVARLRIGMQALVYQADRVVARATVDDLNGTDVAATVVYARDNEVQLAARTRIQFVAETSPVAMTGARVKSITKR